MNQTPEATGRGSRGTENRESGPASLWKGSHRDLSRRVRHCVRRLSARILRPIHGPADFRAVCRRAHHACSHARPRRCPRSCCGQRRRHSGNGCRSGRIGVDHCNRSQPADARPRRVRGHDRSGEVATGRHHEPAVSRRIIRRGRVPVRRDVLPGQGCRTRRTATSTIPPSARTSLQAERSRQFPSTWSTPRAERRPQASRKHSKCRLPQSRNGSAPSTPSARFAVLLSQRRRPDFTPTARGPKVFLRFEVATMTV